MKYRLCLENYSNSKDKKFIEIKNYLSEGNPYSLRDICRFTFGFENALSLKKYLLAKGLINARFLYYDLRIVYNYKGVRSLLVPFIADKEFFSKARMIEFISKEVTKNPEFMELFRRRRHLPDAFYELRFDPYSCNILDKSIEFVEEMCSNSYKGLYDLAMLISKINTVKKENNSKDDIPRASENLTEAEQEEVLVRSRVLDKIEIEGQTSLF